MGRSGHTGLIVYSTIRTANGCDDGAYPGVYSWNGKKWNPLFEKRASINETLKSTDQIDGANSYIVKTNSSVQIPVKRAFDLWNNYSGNNVNDGKVLNKADVDNLAGAFTSEITWEDHAGLLTSQVLTGTNANGIITVNTGATEGNALICLKVNGKSVWYWHIWVTNADIIANSKIYYSDAGSQYIYMGANLGGTSSSENGLFFQWGRSMPLRADMSTIYIDNISTPNKSLTAAIQSTDMLPYIGLTSFDWYSDGNDWLSRWGSSSTGQDIKSPFDPCPYGWRIPSAIENTDFPWGCDSNDDDITAYPYPLSGFLSNGDGALTNQGQNGYFWIGSSLKSKGEVVRYSSANSIKSSYNKANAMNVRCVKE